MCSVEILHWTNINSMTFDELFIQAIVCLRKTSMSTGYPGKATDYVGMLMSENCHHWY